MDYIMVSIICIFIIMVFTKLILWPIKLLFKILVNGAIGIVLLVIFNYFGNNFHMFIPFNPFTILVSGFGGVPGIIFLIIFKLYL